MARSCLLLFVADGHSWGLAQCNLDGTHSRTHAVIMNIFRLALDSTKLFAKRKAARAWPRRGGPGVHK